MTSIRSELRLLGSLKARKIVQPGLLASAWGEVAFFASAWAIGSILLWHEKWNQVPTDMEVENYRLETDRPGESAEPIFEFDSPVGFLVAVFHNDWRI